jgi:two-component system NtrC family sensor kinase
LKSWATDISSAWAFIASKMGEPATAKATAFGRFHNLPIRIKASAASAVLLICLLAVGANAYLTSTRTAVGLRTLSQDLITKQQAFADASDAVVALHMKIFRYVTWASNSVSDKVLDPLYAEIDQDLGTLSTRIGALALRRDLSSQEQAGLQQLLSKWQDCKRKAKDTIDVGQTDAAMATMMLGETDDSFKAVDSDLKGMSQAITAAGNSLSTGLYTDAQRNRLIIIVGTGVGFVIAAFIAMLVGASIVTPIRSITDVMQRLSSGETDVEIGGRERHDEIGMMAEAIDVFRRNIIEKHATEHALTTELREALDQQTATAELLQVINASPGKLAPVFDAMLERVLRLCEAAFGSVWICNSGLFDAVATVNRPPELGDLVRREYRPAPDSALGRLIAGERYVHVADAAEDPSYRRGSPARRALVDRGGARTYIAVPMRKGDELLGAFTIYRLEIRPFTEKHIELIESFAAQAAMAIASARLLDEIRQRQAELRVTFDNMAAAVAMFDEGLHLAAWNRNFEELLDVPQAFLAEPRSYADYINMLANRGEFGAVDPELEMRRYTENAGRASTVERTRPDGHVLEVRHNPVPGGGFVLIYSDITERKRAEEQIRAARDAAEAALGELKTAQASLIHAEKMASLGQLTAGIAHEIKNPLNFVNNFAGLSLELLDELKQAAGPAIDTLDDDTRAEIDETIAMLSGNLDKIAAHGRRADGIVKSMLAHSRGTSGERQGVDLNALVDEALNLAYHGARAQDQNFNITLERDFAASMPPVELVPQDVTRVFLNLIGNGFHAAHKRQLEVGDSSFRPVLTVATRDLGEIVEVRVRDNGTGIRPEHRDKLFQPFFTTKPTGEGTGLGLSISYDIVTQQHGGTISVDSELGEFTEFTVRLPRSGHMTMAERAA